MASYCRRGQPGTGSSFFSTSLLMNTPSPANLTAMARRARIVAPGVAHHSTQHGGDDPQITQITQIRGKVLPPLLRNLRNLRNLRIRTRRHLHQQAGAEAWQAPAPAARRLAVKTSRQGNEGIGRFPEKLVAGFASPHPRVPPPPPPVLLLRPAPKPHCSPQ